MSFIKPQLALHLHKEQDKSRSKWLDQDFYIFEKYDGWWVCLERTQDDGWSGRMLSRAGRVIPSMTNDAHHLAAHLDTLIPHGNYRLIMEAVIPNQAFHTANGIMNRKDTLQVNQAHYIAHDLVNLDDMGEAFSDRHANLVTHTYDLTQSRYIVYATAATHARGGVEKAMHHAEAIWYRGGEGVILKAADAPYTPGKRNGALMKVKCEVDLDLLIVGATPSKGKYKDRIGALIVEDANGHQYRVSGISDAQSRQPLSELVGQVAHITAMARLTSGALREPRIGAKGIRHDKTLKDID